MDGSRLGRRPLRAHRGLMAVGISLAIAALPACDSDDGGSSTASTVAPATTATTAPPSVQPLTGTLRITGDQTVSLTAATGECRQPVNGLPKSFVVRSPALGANGHVTVFGPTEVPGRGTVPPNLKVFVNGVGMVSPQSGTGVTIAPGEQSAEFDTNLTGTTGNSINGAPFTTGFIRARITGELRCR